MDLTNVTWRKASRSVDNGGNCIEVAAVPSTVAIRDSKDPEGPKLLVPSQDFQRLAHTLKSRE
ncbi:DUF397 domain-containing protein [Actinomadura macrotermitis]|uniref:DUF397 domain-containing protein n=1 Tax=Actinomadura macrotermitis TaxID=2585200 RepID=A0A7K0C2E0_9ACTN|nr:DUF397 domain-containing protein [Actinomadura macrotermitis]MQY06994.1 hypothetical protein [Actinomadura macrotermitis]